MVCAIVSGGIAKWDTQPHIYKDNPIIMRWSVYEFDEAVTTVLNWK